jgi:hypothetical protein
MVERYISDVEKKYTTSQMVKNKVTVSTGSDILPV